MTISTILFSLSYARTVLSRLQEFKIARLSTTIPMMMNFLPMVHSCPSLVKSFLPVLFNPCFCPSLTVHPSCPGMVQDMTKALISLC
ncbi:hypothetical protein E2C01_080603 [Portunus trituberculatus]|uniref:Uncharacterized protein n=1 Tax=Portunus trituberculatus TaxID=210409 RepID=A0A5B7IWK0_PORTR|nr:hypothetical protein [Portunus trituberculatus]